MLRSSPPSLSSSFSSLFLLQIKTNIKNRSLPYTPPSRDLNNLLLQGLRREMGRARRKEEKKFFLVPSFFFLLCSSSPSSCSVFKTWMSSTLVPLSAFRTNSDGILKREREKRQNLAQFAKYNITRTPQRLFYLQNLDSPLSY